MSPPGSAFVRNSWKRWPIQSCDTTVRFMTSAIDGALVSWAKSGNVPNVQGLSRLFEYAHVSSAAACGALDTYACTGPVTSWPACQKRADSLMSVLSTRTQASSLATRPPLAVTVAWNLSSVSLVTAGASNSMSGWSVCVSVAAGPAVCCQWYVTWALVPKVCQTRSDAELRCGIARSSRTLARGGVPCALNESVRVTWPCCAVETFASKL
jgi:hypothetical protein